MEYSIFSLQEIIEASDTDEQHFESWVRSGLIQPVGEGPDHVPFFDSDTLERVRHILKFGEMGYRTEEIRKILRKVGLPESEHSRTHSARKEQFLTVGVLAEQVGVSTRTIKHWEDKGIIAADMRSQGGFRLYREYYVFFCRLIQDLQLFGYSLDEIKVISDFFRVFDRLRTDAEAYSPEETEVQLQGMLDEITRLFEKTSQLKSGIARWEELLKKHRKLIINQKVKNGKRTDGD